VIVRLDLDPYSRFCLFLLFFRLLGCHLTILLNLGKGKEAGLGKVFGKSFINLDLYPKTIPASQP
jgi:hypothetical protein